MKVTFKKLQYRNMLSTGHEYTEISLDGHATTLICGINGSGKSTFMDAITFGLYGKPFRKINKPQLINSVNNKMMDVRVEFVVGPDEFVVVRGMKPNIFEIYRNGELLAQNAENKDYQETLEKTILRMNYKTFCQIVILGSANFVPFMQLPALAKREFGEDMLDIQYFTIMNTLLKARMQTNKDELVATERGIELIQSNIAIIKKHQEEARLSSERMREDKEARIYELEDEYSLLQMDKNKVQAQLDEQAQKIAKKSELITSRAKLDGVHYQTKIKINDAKSSIQFFESHAECPTCTQEIAEAFKAGVLEKRHADLYDLTGALADIENKQAKVDKALNAMGGIEKKISAFRDEWTSINTKMDGNLRVIKSIQEEIANLKTTEIDANALVPYETDLRNSYKFKEEFIKQRDLYVTATALLKDTGIKASIIKQYVPLLNKIINRYLEQMDFFCSFEMNENFEETIKSRFRDEFSYESFSEGEKMRINLSMLFAWREISKMRNSSATNLLILDEVMDGSLDAAGMDEFLVIVKEMAKDNNIFIISHKTDQISDRFDRVIKFQKDMNFSRIVS